MTMRSWSFLVYFQQFSIFRKHLQILGLLPSLPKTSARFSIAESVCVLLTCFSQLGERDLISLFFDFEKTYRLFSFASTYKNNSADFEKR